MEQGHYRYRYSDGGPETTPTTNDGHKCEADKQAQDQVWWWWWVLLELSDLE